MLQHFVICCRKMLAATTKKTNEYIDFDDDSNYVDVGFCFVFFKIYIIYKNNNSTNFQTDRDTTAMVKSTRFQSAIPMVIQIHLK